MAVIVSHFIISASFRGRGGVTVLKVGGANSASGASRNFFDPPPLFGQWGTKYCLDR